MNVALALVVGLAAVPAVYALAPKADDRALLGPDEPKILAAVGLGVFGGIALGAWGVATGSPAATFAAVGLFAGAVIVRERRGIA